VAYFKISEPYTENVLTRSSRVTNCIASYGLIRLSGPTRLIYVVSHNKLQTRWRGKFARATSGRYKEVHQNKQDRGMLQSIDVWGIKCGYSGHLVSAAQQFDSSLY
jgi:hypothetical protein